MAYQATEDLLESPIRFFEMEDSIGSKNVIRRQLTIASDSAIPLSGLREGHWVQPHPTKLHEYISVGAAPSASPKADHVPAYVVLSLTGSQPDVLESGGVTGGMGIYNARTKIFNTLDATYAPGNLLTLALVDIGDGGGAVHPGLLKTGATVVNAVAKVEFFDAANGVLHFIAVSGSAA